MKGISAKGFTLIELMVVVSIIGTLAAIAIPAYQDYTIRAQVSEGLRLAAGARSAVEDHYAQNGAWPADNSAAALADQHDIVGRYTEHVNVQANVIEIEYALDAHQSIHDKNVLLTASTNDGSISWSCTGVGIPDNQLPRSCRGRPAKIR